MARLTFLLAPLRPEIVKNLDDISLVIGIRLSLSALLSFYLSQQMAAISRRRGLVEGLLRLVLVVRLVIVRSVLLSFGRCCVEVARVDRTRHVLLRSVLAPSHVVELGVMISLVVWGSDWPIRYLLDLS